MKAVVTGAAGFIGSHLVESLLADGHDVLGIDAFVDFYPRPIKEKNLERARAHARFELAQGRLQDLDLRGPFEGAAQIFHLAAQAGVRSSWGAEFSLYTDHNVLATQRVLEACVASGTPRLVLASSSSVYGDASELPLRETTECRPISPYGVTKLACEHLSYLYGRLHGLPAVSLRYFTVYGPRQRPDMAFHRFLRSALDDDEITIFGDGEQTRDFTFVSDIVRATRAAADSGRPGCAYNVGGGERLSINSVLAMIEETTGRRLRVRRQASQKGDMRDTFADTAAAARDLAFCSSIGLTEGLVREWDWIRSVR